MQNQPPPTDYAVTHVHNLPLTDSGVDGIAYHGTLSMLMGDENDPILECGDFGNECADVQDEYVHSVGCVVLSSGGFATCLHSALVNGTILAGWLSEDEIQAKTDEHYKLDPAYNRLEA